MNDSSSRQPRKVAIADHLWDVFEKMSSQMGADRDALINQAMFMFARLNGFLESASSHHSSSRAPTGPAGVNAPSASAPKHEEASRREVAERVLETAAELERMIKSTKQEGGGPAKSVAAGVDDNSGAGLGLYIMAESGELERVAKDRFIVGRGKHCDFVVNSGKVSREHAAIVREGTDYYVEDLGSSNGTWFNKQRIKRRKIEENDEYYICSEKVRFVFR